jgi:hypothetical protein
LADAIGETGLDFLPRGIRQRHGGTPARGGGFGAAVEGFVAGLTDQLSHGSILLSQSSELKPQSLLWDHYGSMSVRKEFVRLLASKVVEELVQQEMIGVPEGLDLTETLYEVMEKETSLEDRLNEEVRLVLNQYQDQMRSSGASYQEMFKLIKNKLVKERKLVL